MYEVLSALETHRENVYFCYKKMTTKFITSCFQHTLASFSFKIFMKIFQFIPTVFCGIGACKCVLFLGKLICFKKFKQSTSLIKLYFGILIIMIHEMINSLIHEGMSLPLYPKAIGNNIGDHCMIFDSLSLRLQETSSED